MMTRIGVFTTGPLGPCTPVNRNSPLSEFLTTTVMTCDNVSDKQSY